MPKHSAGLLVYRNPPRGTEVLLGHPGGPFWRARDLGAWSIFKGELNEGEEPAAAARREFAEETGWAAAAALEPLGDIRQAGGKIVSAFAMAGDFEPDTLRGNGFDLEWPPRSGHIRTFPEIDRAGWFALPEARLKILAGQVSLLDRLAARLGDMPPEPS
jgi:predicted NUDIX family NTP pyrophosphohydrolase